MADMTQITYFSLSGSRLFIFISVANDKYFVKLKCYCLCFIQILLIDTIRAVFCNLTFYIKKIYTYQLLIS